MRLRYTRRDGTHMEFELGDKPITIGRSPDADVILLDERVSRIHCGIRLWDGDFFLKDLKSRNGTFVNGQAVEVTKLEPGDTIRVGSTVFVFEQNPAEGAETALKEISDEMEHGKGYSTILREIVRDASPGAESNPGATSDSIDAVSPDAPPPEPQPQPQEEQSEQTLAPPSPPPGTTPTTEQKPVRVIIKKKKIIVKPKDPLA
jgi:pSer/pThr/pTyr-binding forkhead associated (FHA) protein